MFLFELALVLTRLGEDREGGHLYQVYRQPFPNALLNLEDIPDSEAGGGGTFRTAFTGGNDKGQSRGGGAGQGGGALLEVWVFHSVGKI